MTNVYKKKSFEVLNLSYFIFLKKIMKMRLQVNH